MIYQDEGEDGPQKYGKQKKMKRGKYEMMRNKHSELNLQRKYWLEQNIGAKYDIQLIIYDDLFNKIIY